MWTFTSKLPRGVRRLFRLAHTPERALRDIDEEIRNHIELRVAELRARGMSEADAEREALRRFGDTEEFRAWSTRRALRRSRKYAVIEWFADLTQDIGFALRQFRKTPSFTAIAVLTLALGIGANTAIFSVVHHLLLEPLPYPNGNRIVTPMLEDDNGLRTSANRDLVLAWRERTHTIESFAAAVQVNFSIDAEGNVDMTPNARITSSFLPLLGVRPALGRGFTPEEEYPRAHVAMISYERWQREYGGRPDVLGKKVDLDLDTYTIVGVAPAGLAVPMSSNPAPEIWIPMSLDGVGTASSNVPSAFGLLRRDASADAASRELQTIAASLPETAQKRPHVSAMRAQDFLSTRETRSIQVLFAAVGGLLLIACANVANLLLARAAARRRELAVRVALGAGRWRLARQMLTESVLLALAGGILGIAVAWETLKIIVALRPPALEHLAVVRIDPAVLAWSAIISVATGIIFGCFPALVAGARKAVDVLRSETRTGSGGPASRRTRSVLIVVEIAMSLVLLVGAGLLVRSFVELQRMPLGYEPRGLVYTSTILGNRSVKAEVPAMRDAVIERLRSLPGVTGVAVGTLPGEGFTGRGLETEPDASGMPTRIEALSTVFMTPDYFQVAGMHLVAGRLPDPNAMTAEWKEQTLALSPEIVVNQELAKRLWPDGNAIGKRVRQSQGAEGTTPPAPPGMKPYNPWVTVVGVVNDTRMPTLHGDLRWLQVYSLAPPRFGVLPFLIRTQMHGPNVTGMMERAIASADRRIVVRPALSGDVYLRDSLAPTEFAMALLTAFAIIALVLAAVGLYGVIAYSVNQRTREIGVRVALGADPRAVMGLVLGSGIRLAVAGVVMGATAAAGATRVLRSMLYGVGPGDPWTFVVIGVVVGGVAILASWVPARLALRVEPVEALREL